MLLYCCLVVRAPADFRTASCRAEAGASPPFGEVLEVESMIIIVLLRTALVGLHVSPGQGSPSDNSKTPYSRSCTSSIRVRVAGDLAKPHTVHERLVSAASSQRPTEVLVVIKATLSTPQAFTFDTKGRLGSCAVQVLYLRNRW